MDEHPASERKRDIIYILSLVLLVFIANWRFMFSGHTYQNLGGLNHDFEAVHFLVMNYLHEHYLRGFFPLWLPYYSFGQPGLASYLPALFLPNSAAFFSLIEYPASLISFTVANYLLTATFSFMLFRRLGMSGFSSFFAAAWNTLAGYSIWISHYHNIFGFLPWFYLFMWAVTGIIKKNQVLAWLAGVAAASLMLLSGDAEELTYAFYFGGLWLLVYTLGIKRSAAPGEFANNRLRLLLLIAFMVGFASLISSLQVWPTLNFLSRTVRVAGLTPPSFVESFASPYEVFYPGVLLFSRRLENLYLGAIPLFLMLTGLLLVRKNPARTASLIVLAVMVAILLGSRLGLSRLLYHLPLFSLFIRHFKTGFILQFCFIILCGFGLDFIRRKIPGPSRGIIAILLLFGLVNVVTLPGTAWRVFSLLMLFGLVISAYRGDRPFIVFMAFVMAADICSYLWTVPRRLERPRYWPVYEDMVKDQGAMGRSQVMYPGLSMFQTVRHSSLPVQVGGWDEALSFDSWMSFPLSTTARFMQAVEPKVTTLQKGGYTSFNFSTFFKALDFIRKDNRHLINMASLRYVFCEDMALKEAELRPILSDPEYFLNPINMDAFSPYRRELRAAGGEETPVLSSRESGSFRYESSFDPGGSIRFSVSLAAAGAASCRFLLLRENHEHSTPLEIFNQDLVLSDEGGRVESLPIEIPLHLSGPEKGALIFNVEVEGQGAEAAWINPVIVNHGKTLKWTAGEGRVMAFENIDALPRARIVHDALAAADDAEALGLVRDGSRFDPALQSVLPQNAPTIPKRKVQGPRRAESAGILEDHEEYVVLEANLAEPGWLVLSDTYYPGWRAFVDGKEKRIYRADLTFRGLLLEPGRHEILFTFQPVDFRVGLWTTLASLVCFGAAVFRAAAQRRRSSC